MIFHKGAPSWFVTFAPSDSKSSICIYYADNKLTFDPISRNESDKYKLIAGNPVTSARYFHLMVQLFIKHVLGIEGVNDGIFENTQAYYDTIEQQARLTLHLHLLL